MNNIIAIEHLTLDGVMQAPGRPDEDTRDGFEFGGWGDTGYDPEMQKTISKYMGGGWSLLSGRRTYEDLYESWHVRQPDNPMTQSLTNVQKFVASHNPRYQLSWENSALLAGDATETVGKLKKEHDKPLIIFGSGELVRSLMRCNLIDEFLLQIHPLVLGKGHRLFDNGSFFTKLSLQSTVIASTGVIITTYKPDSKNNS